MDQISAFLDAIKDLPAVDGDAQLNLQFPEGHALRARVRRAWEGMKQSRLASATDRFNPDERLEIEGHELIRLLGEGGNGFVYLANQKNPRRHVAVKFLKTRLGQAGTARLEREISLLSRLTHPDIITVFEAGETADGLPYFVMEYVDGKTIVDYCDDKALDLEKRLQLIVRVCRAVEYSHRRETIHRDLKPSNILVSLDGHPKIIDFGIAKLMYSDPDDELVARCLGRQPYDPQFSSPELEDNLVVDAATDVYSLGVVLYRLLTGTLVNKRNPVRPSKIEVGSERLTSIDTGVGLKHRLAADLDAIVMKAIDPQPAQRYGGPGELADDLERFLQNKPVLATEPTRWYVMRLFVLRNPKWVAVSALLVISLISTTTVALWQKGKAEDAMRKAIEDRSHAVLSKENAEQQKILQLKTADAFEVAVEQLAEKLTGDIQQQQSAVRNLYVEMAEKFRKPLSLRLTLVRRALQGMSRDDPRRDRLSKLDEELALKTNASAKGGDGDLPKGPTSLALLNAQLK